MAFGSTPTDGSGIPAGSVYVPGIGFKVLQGGTVFNDANANDSAPARMELVGGSKASYSYAIQATAPYATPTDWIVLRGSATKLVKVTRIELSGAATAATEVTLTLKKHTIANTAGTSTNPTPVKHDSNDGTATATLLLYTVAPTIDATAAIFRPVRLTLAVAPAATTVNPDRYVQEFGAGPYEPLVLRGVAQELALNFAGAAVPSGGVFDVVLVWTEE